MWPFNLLRKDKVTQSSTVGIDELNESADFLFANNMLLGQIKPFFRRTANGEFELMLDNVNAKIKELGIEATSLQALSINETYLTDVQNVMKRAEAQGQMKR